MYLDYKTDPRDYYVIDIEADSLYPTVIWCMCYLNIKTGEKGDCVTHDEIKAFFERTKGSVYIGHNSLKFDAPHLVRLLGVRLSTINTVDTLVLSTLYSPSLEGGHSLAEWGERLGFAKGDFHDWSRLSDEMLVYCRQDVLITAKLYVRLVATLNRINFSEQSCWIQHRFTVILERQHRNGFFFDGPRAISLYTSLRQREEELADDIRMVFPASETCLGERSMYRKDGSYSAIYLKDRERYRIEEVGQGGRYRLFESSEFSVGSPKQRVDKLLALGWQPEEFTDAGNPKPFDKGKLSPSLERFLEQNPVPEVELIARWMSVNGRGNMINTWIDNWNEDDSCIHGKLFVADTLRLRHQAPNTANIPAVRVGKDHSVLMGESGYYTYEARDLWCARPGRVLVGTDAAGLELRMLSHYLNRPDFTRAVVEGDPHQYNADTVGITRPQAKTLIYAILYGAGDAKVARTLGLPVITKRGRDGKTFDTSPEGKKVKELFLERLGIKELIEECKDEQRNGRVSLVDGSQVICPSPHAALNYKLQGGGARVMAMSSVIADQEVRRNGWDVLKVGDIHDEDQSDSAINDAQPFGEMRVESIVRAGQEFSLTVPLGGEYKIGETWAETH